MINDALPTIDIAWDYPIGRICETANPLLCTLLCTIAINQATNAACLLRVSANDTFVSSTRP